MVKVVGKTFLIDVYIIEYLIVNSFLVLLKSPGRNLIILFRLRTMSVSPEKNEVGKCVITEHWIQGCAVHFDCPYIVVFS